MTQQEALEKPVVRAAYFLELQFASGTVRVCSYSRTFTWGGTQALTSISQASPAVVTKTAHGYANGDRLRLTTTGALPLPLATGTDYYVVNAAADTFNLAATPGGATINTTTAGSGTHSATAYYNWIGLGSFGKISPLEESAGVASSAMTFSLNVTQLSLLSLALGNVEDYRGRSAKLYFCPLDENGNLIGDPVICWRGLMDTMTVGVDGEEGQINLKCETSAYGLRRRPSLRLNKEQQQQRYPEDTGLNYLTDLVANPQQWLSKKFQQI